MKYLVLFTVLVVSTVYGRDVSTAFTPTRYHGDTAFSKTFKMMKSARKEVLVTVYSWSLDDFTKTLESLVAKGIKTRVILHPKLVEKVSSIVVRLERKSGSDRLIEFKVAPFDMHEKFVIIDDEHAINSSANMSGGARSRYSENFVFFEDAPKIAGIFKKEFTKIWNASRSITTRGETPLPKMATPTLSTSSVDGMTFLSSSMNFSESSNRSKKEGQYTTLKKKRTQVVTNEIIKEIGKAKKSIDLCLNHFFLPSVNKAVVSALKRGVKIRFMVDNQEFKPVGRSRSRTQTVNFVKDYRSIYGNDADVPVRVKYYSLYPSPSFWLLNHHKFILIDAQTSSPVTITGSHNLSYHAENGQFDNMVFFRGKSHNQIHKDFYNEFEFLWTLGRGNGDRASGKTLAHFTKSRRGSVNLHASFAQSLKWSEVENLRNEVSSLARSLGGNGTDIFKKLNRSSSACKTYNPKRRSFYPRGCANQKLLEVEK